MDDHPVAVVGVKVEVDEVFDTGIEDEPAEAEAAAFNFKVAAVVDRDRIAGRVDPEVALTGEADVAKLHPPVHGHGVGIFAGIIRPEVKATVIAEAVSIFSR